MNEVKLDEIHTITLEILKKIIEICDQININYYIAYGSLIGTIRHKGFIPWDDDCDIIMLRPEYDKFCDYCYKHEKELKPFKLLTREVLKEYPYNIARLNDMRYKAVYKNVIEYESGAFVDIYPLDGAGNDKVEIEKKIMKKKKNLFRLTLWSIDDHYEPSTYKKWYRSMVKFIIRKIVKIIGSNYFLNKLENYKNIYDYEDSIYIAELVWDSPLILYKKEWFNSYKYMDFEGIKVKVPNEYDKVLKSYYGDYMKLPPKEERIPQHNYKLYKRKDK